MSTRTWSRHVIGLYLLVPVVKQELTSFRDKIRSGEVQKNEKVGS